MITNLMGETLPDVVRWAKSITQEIERRLPDPEMASGRKGTGLVDATDDADARSKGVRINQDYRTGSVRKVRVA